MSTEKLSDAEVHELVIQQIRAITREEWQERIDEAVALFGDEETADEMTTPPSTGKYGVRGSNRSVKTSGIVLNGSSTKSHKLSKKKLSRPAVQV